MKKDGGETEQNKRKPSIKIDIDDNYYDNTVTHVIDSIFNNLSNPTCFCFQESSEVRMFYSQ